MIETAWAKNYPDEKILKIVFHHGSWKEEKGIRWDKGYQRWERYDREYLPTTVIVHESDRVAVMYVAYINKNNLAGTMNAGVGTRSGEHVVKRILTNNLE